MENILKWGALAFLVQGFGVLMAVLIAFPTMLLWNFAIPGIFGLPIINFFQALALALLSSMLFNLASNFILLGVFLNKISA